MHKNRQKGRDIVREKEQEREKRTRTRVWCQFYCRFVCVMKGYDKLAVICSFEFDYLRPIFIAYNTNILSFKCK